MEEEIFIYSGLHGCEYLGDLLRRLLSKLKHIHILHVIVIYLKLSLH